MRAKLREVKDQLKRRLHEPIPVQGRWLRSVLQCRHALTVKHNTLPCPAPPVTMPTNPSPRERNRRHVADQAVTVPTKASIPVCTVDDVFNRRFNDGPQT